MSGADPLSYDAALEEYQRQADALFQALRSGADEARWRFKWEHPRFRGKSVGEVDAATLDLADAQRFGSIHRSRRTRPTPSQRSTNRSRATGPSHASFRCNEAEGARS
jgi:ribosomal protein L13E